MATNNIYLTFEWRRWVDALGIVGVAAFYVGHKLRLPHSLFYTVRPTA